MNSTKLLPSNGAVITQANPTATYFSLVPKKRLFSIIGDNGLCFTDDDYYVISALRKLVSCEIMEVANGNQAQLYAYERYVAKFLGRNSNFGIQVKLPINLPPNTLWIDEDYEIREQRLRTNDENRI